MKKAKPMDNDELLPEYRREDLGKGVRGKYHAASLLSKLIPTQSSQRTAELRREYGAQRIGPMLSMISYLPSVGG